MTIKLKPSDLVKLFLWDSYKHFCLDTKTKSEIKEILAKDEEFIISDKDAFVINLTNVLYTPNVDYKFNQFILSILINKSFDRVDDDGKTRKYINKQFLTLAPEEFKNKIPQNWSCDDKKFMNKLNKMDEINAKFLELLDNLATVKVQKWPCVKISQVKKIVKKLSIF